MAIVKFGPLIVGARGTIAGTTFSANKAGPFAKGWAQPSNPKTPSQSTQRANLGDFAQAWQALAQAERDDWDDYAALPAQDLQNSLGETYSISGFNWFVRINLNLRQAGAAQRDDAPTLTRPAAAVINNFQLRTTSAVGLSRIVYDVTDPDLTANHTVFAALVNSEGVTVRASNFAHMTTELLDGADRIIFQDELEDHFGTILLGQRCFVETAVQDAHGQRGPVDTARADAVA